MEWSGFTDEDLRRLKKSFSSDAAETNHPAGNRTRKSVPRNVRSKRPVASSHEGHVHDSVEPIKPEQRLVQSSDSRSSSSRLSTSERTSASSSSTGTSDPQLKETSNKNTDTAVITNTDIETKPPDSDSNSAIPADNSADTNFGLDDQTILTKELASLDKFREHQKMIEELNARKKKMLSDAIKQRQHKAKAESAKLNLIKQELDRLDQMINSDISVIRDKIEVASREFLEAQKRYDRAEREFIEAKTDLHNKSEAKDLLTEHLYTVIHQNEVRKAKKLAELTHKLELETAEDDAMVDAAQTVPVPLCLVMPLNQLTSHTSLSPSSTQSPTQSPTSPDTQNGQTIVEQPVSSDGGCDTVASTAPPTTDATEAVTTADSNSAVPSTGVDDAPA